MSLILPEIMKELEAVVKEWYEAISCDVSTYAACTSDSGQNQYLDSIDRNTRLWGKLSNITLRATTAMSAPAPESSREAMSRIILDGIVEYLKTARLAAFSERCRGLLPPSKVEFNNASRSRLHEMIFLPSDCFSELSNIHPGNHGWVFVFRNDLKEWLLKTLDPFTVTYQDANGHSTVFGVYEAIQFPEGNMTGPEIIHLSELTQGNILAQASKDVQKEDHEVMRKALLASHLTISCFLLQCREMPAPSSVFNQGRPPAHKIAPTLFSQNLSEVEKIQYSYKTMCSDSGVLSTPSTDSNVIGAAWGASLSQHSAPFHAFAGADPGVNFTAPVAQADPNLGGKSSSGANSAAQDNMPGPDSASTFVSNMAVNASHAHMVPVPGPASNERRWYNEDGFHHSQGYPPPAYQNHPSKNHLQDQIQFTEAQNRLPPRLRKADGRGSASYGIPLRVSTNTRGPALGYASQFTSQPPTSQAPPNNYRAQRSHGDNHNQNQNTNPAWATNGENSRATAGGAHAGEYQQEHLAQPFSNVSLATRPRLPRIKAHDYRRQPPSEFVVYPPPTAQNTRL